MTTRNTLSFFVAAGLTACGPMQGSGVPSAETRTFEAIDSLVVSGSLSAEVQIRPGPLRVDLSGDDNLLAYVESVADGTTLHVSKDRALIEEVPLSVVISAPSLSSVTLSGSGRVDVTGDYGGALRLAQDGSGTLIGRGSVDALTVTRSGSGAVQAGTLAASSVNIDASGSGHAWVCATESITGTRGGSGDVVVRCDPEVVDVEDLGSDTTLGEVVLLP
jgi:hypothetical protein